MSAKPPRKQPRQSRSIATVDRIVDAAGRILLESGYERTTTHRIAHEAGVSPGSVYQYFADKDSILHTAVDRLVRSLGEHLAAVATESVNRGDDALRTMVEATLTAAEQNRELTRFVLTELPHLGGSGVMDQYEKRAHDLARTFLWVRTGQPPVDPASSARIWVATAVLQQTIAKFVTDGPQLDRAALVDALVTALEALFTTEPPG